MKLLLIAGHGAGDPGAVSGNWTEATETRKVVDALADALEGYCEVAQYPMERNAYKDYQSGVLSKQADFSSYDAVLEIHFNASAASASDGKTKGVECYIPTTEHSTNLAKALCRNVAAVGLGDRGVKSYNWAVISAAKRAGTQAMLLEICFIDDPDDMSVYKTKFGSIVSGIAAAIIAEYNLKLEEPPVTYAQFKAFMNQYLDELSSLPPDTWSEAARKWAEDNGIINGTNKGKTKYKASVTREELVQTLYNAVGKV